MDTATLLASLYEIIEKKFGPVKAKKSVSVAVSLAISNIQQKNHSITPENLHFEIEKYVNDFIEVLEAKVA